MPPGKKPKVNPVTTTGSETSDVEVFALPNSPVRSPKRKGKKEEERSRRGKMPETRSIQTRFREIPEGISQAILKYTRSGSIKEEAGDCLMQLVGELQVLLQDCKEEMGRMRGENSVLSSLKNKGVGSSAPSQVSGGQPAQLKMAVPEREPLPTWSLVVRSKDKNASAKEVAAKVVKEVAPSLGVRVVEVKPIKSGGAIIRTPSVAEREKVAKNGKFVEAGLEVSINEKSGVRVVIQGVHSEITPDEFMGDLYEMNLKEECTVEEYKKTVKMVSKPWKSEDGKSQNVILQGEGTMLNAIVAVGRCYIKWFSFRVRQSEEIASCFRCYGTDHRVRDCRFRTDVCRRCGETGHRVVQCMNPLRCRNCAFKGRESGHLMMTEACPLYREMVARARARH